MDIVQKRKQVVDLRKDLSRSELRQRRFDAQMTRRAPRATMREQRTMLSPQPQPQHRQQEMYVGTFGNLGGTTSYTDHAQHAVRARKHSVQHQRAGYKHWLGVVTMIVVAVLLFIFTNLTSIDIFFWIFFVVMFYWDLDSRISIGGALVGLVSIMILLLFGNDFWAEKVAVGVYFFLVIGVVKQLWEYKTESKVKSP